MNGPASCSMSKNSPLLSPAFEPCHDVTPWHTTIQLGEVARQAAKRIVQVSVPVAHATQKACVGVLLFLFLVVIVLRHPNAAGWRRGSTCLHISGQLYRPAYVKGLHV